MSLNGCRLTNQHHTVGTATGGNCGYDRKVRCLPRPSRNLAHHATLHQLEVEEASRGRQRTVALVLVQQSKQLVAHRADLAHMPTKQRVRSSPARRRASHVMMIGDIAVRSEMVLH